MAWRKGISGNSFGRPVGSVGEKEYTAALRLVSKEEVDHPGDQTKKVSKLRRMAEIVFDKALAGESWAVQHISDRLEGKPAQMLEHSGPGGGPIRKLNYEIVHVTETRENLAEELVVDYSEIKTNGNGQQAEARNEITKGETDSASQTPIDLPPPDPGFPTDKPWRPVHQRPKYRRPADN